MNFNSQSIKQEWSTWKPMPRPEECRDIQAPFGPGVYQIRQSDSKIKVLFGIGVQCQKRMKSLYPKPYGVGTRNNADKRNYIQKNWKTLEYRTLATSTREEAKAIEDEIKLLRNHIFNT